MPGALAGVRVLDAGGAPAAYCGKLLAELGADVLKIEPPAGDPGRRRPPFLADEPGLERSLHFAYFNSGKRGITLDRRTRDGAALFRDLVRTADILLECEGVDEAALRTIRPALVITVLTPYGLTGPAKDRPADAFVAFASGGLMYISGEPSAPPLAAPGEQAWTIGSLHAASGSLIALWAARESGRGQLVDMSMQEALATEEHTISRFAHEDIVIHRSGSQHETAAPGTLYPCRDGAVHVFIASGSPGSWRRFAEWIGDPPELRPPAWEAAPYRRAHLDELRRHVVAFTMTRSRRELMEEGQRRHIPCIAVNTPLDYVNDPQTAALGAFVPIDHQTLGPALVPAPPYRFSASPAAIERPAPLLGEHNLDVYCGQLGRSRAELLALYEAGVI